MGDDTSFGEITESHECLWVMMGAHRWSWERMGGHGSWAPWSALSLSGWVTLSSSFHFPEALFSHP